MAMSAARSAAMSAESGQKVPATKVARDNLRYKQGNALASQDANYFGAGGRPVPVKSPDQIQGYQVETSGKPAKAAGTSSIVSFGPKGKEQSAEYAAALARVQKQTGGKVPEQIFVPKGTKGLAAKQPRF